MGFIRNLMLQILIMLFAGSIAVEAAADPSAALSRLDRALISNADGPKWRADYASALKVFVNDTQVHRILRSNPCVLKSSKCL